MIKALMRTSLLTAGIVALAALALGAGAPAQAAKADRCVQAWDCHGPLPQICLKCSDGHFECAHWACVHHRCVVQTCPKK